MSHNVLNPFRADLRSMGRRTALTLLATALATLGAVSIAAAFMASMIPVIGVAGAMALSGLVLLVLAGGVLALSRSGMPPDQGRQAAVVADPLVKLVFDVGFALGSRLARRKL